MNFLVRALRPIHDKLSRFLGFPGLDLEEKFRRMLALCGVFLTSPVLLSFGISHLSKGNSFLGWFLVIAGTAIGSALTILGRFHKAAILAGINLAFAGALFIFLLATSGPHGYMGLWLFIYPLAVFFMLGLRVGTIFCSVFSAAGVLLLIFQDSFPSLIPLERDFKVRFLISFFLVTFLSFFYEIVRHKYQKGIEEKQLRLEEEKRNLQAAKRAAEQASIAKSEFLANMSHELRTPLNHIIGFTELVVDKAAGDLNPQQEEYLGDVLNSSRHLLSLINDILDLSKVEAGKMELHLSEVGLRGVLENSLVMFKEKALKHRLRLSTDLDGIPGRIRADERKLKQIMYNLLSNAIKFTPDGGTVRLSARPLFYRDGGWITPEGRRMDVPFHPAAAGDWIDISIRDTGIGLKKENLERIFAPFEQADNSASRKYQGTGLGLSLTKNFVELHGGRIWAQSEGEGRGSVFSFLIPASPLPAALKEG